MRSSPSPGPSSNLSRPPVLSPQVRWLAGLRGIQFWKVVCVAFGLAVLIGVVLAFIPQPTQGLLGKLGRLLSMLFAAVCCLWMARRAAPGRERVAWGLVALGVIGYVCAETVVFALSLSARAALSPGSMAVLFAP